MTGFARRELPAQGGPGGVVETEGRLASGAEGWDDLSWQIEEWKYDTLYQVEIDNVAMQSREPRSLSYEVVEMATRLPRHEFEITPDGGVIMRPPGKQKRIEAAERAQAEEQEAHQPTSPPSITIH